jgi:hypothetical protein
MVRTVLPHQSQPTEKEEQANWQDAKVHTWQEGAADAEAAPRVSSIHQTT